MTQEDDDRIVSVPTSGVEAAKSRRFLKYFVIWEADKRPLVAELVRVKRDTPDERRVAFNTDIVIPEPLRRRMAADSKFEEEVMTFCTSLGAELVATSRMRFSCPPNTTGVDGVQAFYNYKLRERKRQEEVPSEKVPAEIVAMVREKPDYQEDEEFRKWYWRYVGKRRNEIISEEIRMRYADGIVSGPA